MSEYNGATPLERFKITSNFFENSKDQIFIKKDSIQPYIEKYEARLVKEKREKEKADSIANSKIRLAIALDEASFNDDDRTINVYQGDTLAIFSYKASEDKYVARFRYSNLLFEPEDIEFLDTKTTTTEGQYSWERKTVKTSEDANYLKEKKEEGREQADAKRVPRQSRNPPYGRLSGGNGYFTAILMLESPKRAITTSPAFTAIEAVPLMAFTRPTILPSPV